MTSSRPQIKQIFVGLILGSALTSIVGCGGKAPSVREIPTSTGRVAPKPPGVK
jgi:hypothetical protein